MENRRLTDEKEWLAKEQRGNKEEAVKIRQRLVEVRTGLTKLAGQ